MRITGPVLVEAVTYRFRGHSMADPEQYRSKEEVAHWRERDPIPAFGDQLIAAGIIDEPTRTAIDVEAISSSTPPSRSPRRRPFPPRSPSTTTSTCSTPSVTGRYSTTTTPPPAPPADDGESTSGEIPQQITTALAAAEDASADDAPRGAGTAA